MEAITNSYVVLTDDEQWTYGSQDVENGQRADGRQFVPYSSSRVNITEVLSFKMGTLCSVISLVQPGNWLTSVNLNMHIFMYLYYC